MYFKPASKADLLINKLLIMRCHVGLDLGNNTHFKQHNGEHFNIQIIFNITNINKPFPHIYINIKKNAEVSLEITNTQQSCLCIIIYAESGCAQKPKPTLLFKFNYFPITKG